MSDSLQKTLEDLHDQMARSLLEKLKAGTLTPGEMSIARQFLKDNNITAVPAENSPLAGLVDSLPSFDEDDDDDGDNVVSIKG